MNKEIVINADQPLTSLIEEFEAELDEAIADKLIEVPAEKLGLDPRCGTLNVTEERDCIIIRKYQQGTVEYYGGFEYVHNEDKTSVGSYVIYHDSSDRIDEHLATLDEDSTK